MNPPHDVRRMNYHNGNRTLADMTARSFSIDHHGRHRNVFGNQGDRRDHRVYDETVQKLGQKGQL